MGRNSAEAINARCARRRRAGLAAGLRRAVAFLLAAFLLLAELPDAAFPALTELRADAFRACGLAFEVVVVEVRDCVPAEEAVEFTKTNSSRNSIQIRTA
jgi:hypothetical protein